VWLIVLNLLAVLAVMFPWELGEKADPGAAAPGGIKPEWYFLFMYQALKYFPARLGRSTARSWASCSSGSPGCCGCSCRSGTTRLPEGARNRTLNWVGVAVLLAMIALTAIGSRHERHPESSRPRRAGRDCVRDPGLRRAPRALADQCMACHDEEPRACLPRRHPLPAGVGCAGCHGGDPRPMTRTCHEPRPRVPGKPARKDIVALCGQCHGAADTRWRREFQLTNVVDSLTASVHGEALRGNDRGPQCVSCHGAHGIVAVKDPASPVHPSRVARTCAGCHGDARYMRDFNPRLPWTSTRSTSRASTGGSTPRATPSPRRA